MSLIPFIILQKAAEQKRYSGSKKTAVVKDARKNVSHKGDREYSFQEYMNYKAKYDPKLSNFFKVLGEYGQEIDKLDKTKLLEEFKDICEIYMEKEKVVNERLLEVEKAGVSISKDIKTEKSYAPVSVEEGRGFRRNW